MAAAWLITFCVLGSAISGVLSQSLSDDRVTIQEQIELFVNDVLRPDVLKTIYTGQIQGAVSGDRSIDAATGAASINRKLGTKTSTLQQLSAFISSAIVSSPTGYQSRVLSLLSQTTSSDAVITAAYFGDITGALLSDDGVQAAEPRAQPCLPRFTAGVTPYVRNVILIASMRSSARDAILQAVQTLILSLPESHHVALLTPSNQNSSCVQTRTFYRASSQNVVPFLAQVAQLQTFSSNAESLVRDAFALLRSSASLLTGCVTHVHLFTDGDVVKNLRDLVVEENVAIDARFFTYAIGRGSGVATELRRVACATTGQYFEAVSATNSSAELQSAVLQRHFYIAGLTAPLSPALLLNAGYQTSLNRGLQLQIVLPVFGNNNNLLGVVGMDYALSDLVAFLQQSSLGFSYASLASLDGDAIYHPSVGSGYLNISSAPYAFDIAEFEGSTNSFKFVRDQMILQPSGSASFFVNRELAKGVSAERTLLQTVLMTYYWNQVPSFPLVLILAVARQDASLASYEPASWLPSVYHALPALPSLAALNQQGLSYGTNALHTGTPVSFVASAVKFAPSLFMSDSYATSALDLDSTFVGQIQLYLNDEPGITNPGLKVSAKTDAKITSNMEPFWREVMTNNFYSSTLRIVSLTLVTSTGVLRTFPARAFDTAYNPLTTPWYQRALTNTPSVALSPPYLDTAVLNGALCSDVSYTVLQPNQALNVPVAVVAATVVYSDLQSFLMLRSRCGVVGLNNRCYVIEQAGLLIMSAQGINSGTAPVFLGTVEPELTRVLIDAGFFGAKTVTDSSSGSRTQIDSYVVNSDVFVASKGEYTGSVNLGALSANFSVLQLVNTNSFMVYLFNIASGPGTALAPIPPTPPQLSNTSSSCTVFNEWPVQQSPSCVANPTSADLELRRPSRASCTNVPQVIRLVRWRDGSAVLFLVLMGLGLLTLAVATVLCIIYRSSSVIRSSNLLFVFCSLLAIAIGFCSMLVFIGEPTSAKCILQVLMPNLAFALLFSLLLAKVYRLFRIYENTSLLATTISTSDLLRFAGGVFAFNCLILCLWLVIDRPRPSVRKGRGTGGDWVAVCYPRRVSRWVFLGIDAAYLAVVLIAGTVMSISIRKIHNRVLWGESKYISYAFFAAVLFVAAELAISQVLILSYRASFIITEAILFLSSLLLLTLLFVPKLYILLFQRGMLDKTAAADFASDFQPESVVSVPPPVIEDDL